MNEMQIFFTLLIVGVVGHLFMRRSMDFGNYLRRMIAGQAGEGAAGEITFTPEQQEHINKIVATEKGKFQQKISAMEKEFEPLKQFKTEYEKNQEANNQKALEDAKKYDEAKKGYETKINDLSTKLTDKDRMIQDRDINYALTNEISKNNGYAEETIAMIKSRASVDANGNVVIKDKDANGVDVTLSVAEGVKKFLTERPHLVKAQGKSGAGSGAGDGGAGAGAAGGEKGETLEALNAQLQEAMRGTDLKLRSTLKSKIRALQQKKGVSI